MSARTRRQKAALADLGTESEESLGGNGSVSTPSRKRTPSKRRSRSALREEPDENIFLFAPNLIGESHPHLHTQPDLVLTRT